jgi:RNA polymerase sigma factor (sigma-70 family)
MVSTVKQMLTAHVTMTAGESFPEGFEATFEGHYALVYRTAYGVTGRVEDAEDVVQTIFLRLLQRDTAPDLVKHPKAYLYRAAVNQSLTIVRARRRRETTEAREELADLVPARVSSRAEQVHSRLYEAIAQLGPKAASIVVLRYLHGYTDAEIGQLLGTSRGVIAVTLFRTRARLRTLMASMVDESGAQS